MASITLVKTISRRNPTIIDKLNSFVLGNDMIKEFDSNTTYNPDDLMYTIDDNDELQYYQALEQTSGAFDASLWRPVTVMDIAGTDVLVSDTAPNGNHVSVWVKPLAYDNADIDTIVPEMDVSRLKYSVINGESVSITGLTTLPDNKKTHFNGAIKTPAKIEGVPVLGITASAFKGVTGITHLIITDNITSLGLNAFMQQSATDPDDDLYFTEVTIGYGLTYIPINAFANQRRIQEITIPATVESIESNAFDNCTGLTRITVLNRNTDIELDAFSNCTNLTDVYAPSGSAAEELAIINGYTFHMI